MEDRVLWGAGIGGAMFGSELDSLVLHATVYREKV